MASILRIGLVAVSIVGHLSNSPLKTAETARSSREVSGWSVHIYGDHLTGYDPKTRRPLPGRSASRRR